ncbi:MAG: protein kinase [Labilithrix sp.]|nr:protein kinase [Labilithrix sp.]MCW5814059.1 protein kinase [Labilithrix sp.]
MRAALRNEVAQVELDAGPQRGEAHTLDLHVSGQPPLALLAEPAGPPKNGHFPLRLRPLYRAQAAQLYALLQQENVSVDGPPPDTSPSPNTTLDPPRFVSQSMPRVESASMRAAANSTTNPPRPQIQPIARPAATTDPQPLPARHPSAAAAPSGDPRRTAPSASWSNLTADPRRTAPSSTWNQRIAPAPPPSPPQIEEEPHGADADDPSLSVSVVFEPDDVPLEVQAMRSNTTATYGSPPVARPIEVEIPPAPETDEDPFPADLEEPSLSVSVVFEPDALPAGITLGIPSPLGDDVPATQTTPESDVPATIADVDALPIEDGITIDVDASPVTGVGAVDDAEADAVLAALDEMPPPTTPPLDESSGAEAVTADDFGGFFDEALANFPSAAPDAMDEAFEVAPPAEEPPTDDVDVDSGGTAAMAHAPIASLEDFPDIDELPESEDMMKTQVPASQRRELELGPLDDEMPPVPLPGSLDDDDDDDDATLIRLPTKGKPPQPLEPIVRPEARSRKEHTPTQETRIGGGNINIDETQVPPSQPLPESRPKPARRGPIPEDDQDTTALRKAPVPPPSSDPHDPNDPAIGRRIADGKYVIESLIGAGAAGAVYRATHRELRRTVAIKLLHPHYQQDPHFMTSFRGEALAASQLDHPNVMRVLDFGQEPDGLVYIVMEYLSGRTLQQRLDEERRLPTEKAVEVMIQVCAALSVAHDHGIIHRDIKPDNIMLVPSRNDEGTTFELVKVCDFGIAALQNPNKGDEALAATEHVIAGTPEYMSPEQARGAAVDARADVYACGICLYELVTGRPPFLGNNAAEILIKQLDETPIPPSQIVKGLDPIIEEIILRAIQKDSKKRHQSAREMRVELKELIDPGDAHAQDDEDELSIVENVAVLDDPASGFPGFFIAFSSAVLRFGRFERGHNESAQAMKELQKQVRIALRGRSELTFARRDSGKTPGFCVMTGTAEIVDLKRLLGSQLMGSFGEPFTTELVKKGVVALTLREGIPDVELHYIIEMLLGPFAHEDLRKELLSKPLRNISILFPGDVVGHTRKLHWKVGLCAARLARDLRALCNIRGISLKKMRETRDELIGGVARLLTRGDEVKQFLFNADLVDEAVANLRGFSSFKVAPLVVERVLHESCAEAATLLLHDLDAASLDEQERLRPYLHMFGQRLVTERSPKSDAAVAEMYRRKIVSEEEMPRDLKEQIRAASLADALVRDATQFLRTLDMIRDGAQYEDEIAVLETAMSTLARRAETTALMAVMSTLSHHAKPSGNTQRENAALRAMKRMIDVERLAPTANTLLVGPPHQREAARQLIILAGSVGAQALYNAREATQDPAARPVFVQVMHEAGPAGWSVIAQILPRLEVAGDHELALVEDLLRALPERADPALGEAVSKFLSHPVLRQIALTAIVPLWGERAKKPLVEALEYADEPTRIVALGELRRLHAIDEYVFSVIERFLTMKGSAGEDLRVAAAAALADAATPVRTRAVQMLTKVVEGKRGLVALIRGTGDNEETASVLESMGRALLALDRNEGLKALKGRVSRSDGATKQRLQALLQSAQ